MQMAPTEQQFNHGAILILDDLNLELIEMISCNFEYGPHCGQANASESFLNAIQTLDHYYSVAMRS
jgi:hypothetical protein